jgi:hypothetical protein
LPDTSARHHTPVLKRKYVEVIAADCFGRLPGACNLKALDLRSFPRQQVHLDLMRLVQLGFLPLPLHLPQLNLPLQFAIALLQSGFHLHVNEDRAKHQHIDCEDQE